MIRILIFISVVFSANSFSQNPSLLKQETIDTLRFVRDNFKYENDILHTIKNDKSIKAWTKYYIFKSFRCLVERKNDSALVYAKKAIDIFHKKESSHLSSAGLIHKAFYIKGLREYFKSKHLSAVKSFNEGLNYIEKYPKCYDGKSWKAYIYSFLSDCHYEMGDINLALQFKKKSLLDYRMRFKYFASTSLLSIGNLYTNLKNIDSAKIYTQKALKILNDTTLKHTGENSLMSLNLQRVESYNNLGDYYYSKDNLDSALIYYEKAHKEFTDKNISYKKNSKTKFFMKANQAYVLFKHDSIKKSLNLLFGLIDSINKFDDYSRKNKRLYLKVNDFLKQIHIQKGDYKKVVLLNYNVIKYLEAYNEKNISKHLQLLSIEFDTQTKENQIKSLSLGRDQQEIEIKFYQIIAVVLITLTIIIISFFLYYKKIRSAQSEYEKENLKQRLMLMQMNPHFIFNAFSSIAGKIVSQSENTLEYIKMLSLLFRNILKNSSEEFVTLREEIALLNNYLEVQSDFLEKFNFMIEVDSSLKQDLILIPPMLLQPLIENSIVHGIRGNNGFIKLNIKKTSYNSKLLTFKIYDNGVGFNESDLISKKETDKSYSIILIKERLNILKKRFNQDLELKYLNQEKGTIAYLSLPLIMDS